MPLPGLWPSREVDERRELTHSGCLAITPSGRHLEATPTSGRPPLVIAPLGEADEALEDGRGELKANGLLDADARRLPPAARLHGGARDEDALEQLVVVGLRPVEREEAAAGAHPRERHAGVAQEVLEHPVVAAGLGVDHGPDGEPVCKLEREPLRLEGLVRLE